jgi:sulfite reductase beta subunit-like hemoprotein
VVSSLFFRGRGDIPGMTEKPNPTDCLTTTSLVALAQTAIGCGIGLLLAGKMGRTAQRTAAIATLAVGVVATVPVVYEIFSRQMNHPQSARRMRKRLESIREDSGFSDEVEAY